MSVDTPALSVPIWISACLRSAVLLPWVSVELEQFRHLKTARGPVCSWGLANAALLLMPNWVWEFLSFCSLGLHFPNGESCSECHWCHEQCFQLCLCWMIRLCRFAWSCLPEHLYVWERLYQIASISCSCHSTDLVYVCHHLMCFSNKVTKIKMLPLLRRFKYYFQIAFQFLKCCLAKVCLVLPITSHELMVMMHIVKQLCNVPLAWSFCVVADLSEQPQLKVLCSG